MDDRQFYEVIRKVLVNSAFPPADFLVISQVFARLEEKLAALPAPEAPKKKREKRVKG